MGDLVLRKLSFPDWGKFEDAALLVLRVSAGLFLLYQSHDNVLSRERMDEFVAFMAHFDFWQPRLLAPFAIFWQVAAGMGFVLGFLVRPLGLITALQFVIAVLMVHLSDPANILWSALSLAVIGLYLAARGGGRYAIDALLQRRSDIVRSDRVASQSVRTRPGPRS